MLLTRFDVKILKAMLITIGCAKVNFLCDFIVTGSEGIFPDAILSSQVLPSDTHLLPSGH